MKNFIISVLMVDGTQHEVKAILADQVGFSLTRSRHNWPTMQDDPLLFTSFMAFMAMKRTKKFEGSWEDFLEQVEGVSADKVDEVDPTLAATAQD